MSARLARDLNFEVVLVCPKTSEAFVLGITVMKPFHHCQIVNCFLAVERASLGNFESIVAVMIRIFRSVSWSVHSPITDNLIVLHFFGLSPVNIPDVFDMLRNLCAKLSRA